MQTDAIDAGAAPAETSRIVIERPPPGLARGKYPWPAWGIGVLGVGILVVGLVYFVVLARRRRAR
ncbi:MAG: hypothetical protein IT377_32490 [Polyangiaceae bacterium]|nr:hypothetical protein [Myxococcales bacterium]MCC6903732.1 hypothetical protein [Polyangiaceae bacterium]